MRKAWCDICGQQLPSAEDMSINKFILKTSYEYDCENEPVNINADICEECLIQFFNFYADHQEFNQCIFNESEENK